MRFKEFILEAKTYRDDNGNVTVYHISSEGDIKQFSPKVNKILREPVTFFSPSYKSIFQDWAYYVMYRKNKNDIKRSDEQHFKNLYLYTVKIPKDVYKDSVKFMDKKFEEDERQSMGFWAWGSQIALTKEQLELVNIIKVQKLTEQEIKKINSYIYKSQSQDINYSFDLSYLKKQPKNWLNEFHIKLKEEIPKKSNEDIKEKLESLEKSLKRLRINFLKNGNITIKDIGDIDKNEVKKIENSFNTLISKRI
jgi:hypothetical protein